MKRKQSKEVFNNRPLKRPCIKEEKPTLDQNINSLEAIFTPPLTQPSFRGDHGTNDNYKLTGNYEIHTLKTLARITPTNGETIKLRYVLTKDGEFLIAPEGKPNKILGIPPHFAMTGMSRSSASCISAGNIIIDYEGIIHYVNNQSGDFKPDFNSLQFVLGVLVSCNAKLAQTFVIEDTGQSKIYKIDANSVKKYVHERFTDAERQNFKEKNEVLSRPLVKSYGEKSRSIFRSDGSTNTSHEEITEKSNTARKKLTFNL